MMPTFDGKMFANGWLAVSTAASEDSQVPALYRTVLVECLEEGVRLISTDGVLLLKCWVPFDEDQFALEPSFDEVPEESWIVTDRDRRSKSLLGYVAKITSKEGADQVALRMRIDDHVGDDGTLSFDGMERRSMVLECEDRERVRLPLFDGQFPPWRTVLPQQSSAISELTLSAEQMARIAKLKNFFGGALIDCRFHGDNMPVDVSIRYSDPVVDGCVMPIAREVRGA
jgi:hypothetical protein